MALKVEDHVLLGFRSEMIHTPRAISPIPALGLGRPAAVALHQSQKKFKESSGMNVMAYQSAAKRTASFICMVNERLLVNDVEMVCKREVGYCRVVICARLSRWMWEEGAEDISKGVGDFIDFHGRMS
jgi:hypothetical protein